MKLTESRLVSLANVVNHNDLVYADKGENIEKKYYVTDPHGNVVQLTDESGKVVRLQYGHQVHGGYVNGCCASAGTRTTTCAKKKTLLRGGNGYDR